jgi:small subunit ribosomal protein S3Ae
MASDNKKSSKPAAKKVKDRWKAKEWYKLYAPKMFNQVLLGETPSSDPSNLMGRIVEATVHDLTGDFSKMHVKLTFKVKEVRGFDAHTVFIGQTLTSDYVRRLTRRKRTKTDHVIDVRTKDGYLLRIKPMSVTDKRIQSSQETAVRNAMTNEVTNMGIEMTMADMVKVIITGEMSKRLSNAAKVIVPIKRSARPRSWRWARADRTSPSYLSLSPRSRSSQPSQRWRSPPRPRSRPRKRRSLPRARRSKTTSPCRGGSAWWSVGLIGNLGKIPPSLQRNPKVMGSNPIPGTSL